MQLYIDKSGKLEQIKDIGFKLEKEMQNLTENNLENIFGLEFIKSEFSLNNSRIDTLAFDNENNSFVIIEFKKGSSYSVIDQGFTYLSMLLNNKANFVHELGKKRNIFIDMNNIDWSQSKVIFIADSFTRYQKESINFKDLPIELYEMKQFNNGIIIYNSILATNTTESIKTITKLETKELNIIESEIKTYSLNELLKNNWIETKELFEELREYILSLDQSLEENYHKHYIGYKNGFQNLVLLHLKKSGIEITFVSIHKEDLNDFKNMIKNIPEERGWGKKSIIFIKDKDDLFYSKELLKEAYIKYNK